MDFATIYGAWRMYKYVSAAYSTYETAVAVYGTACTVAATTGAVVGYIAPSWTSQFNQLQDQSCLILEHDNEWEVIDLL